MALVPLEHSRYKGLSKQLVYDPPRRHFLIEVSCCRPPRRQSPKTDKPRQWTHKGWKADARSMIQTGRDVKILAQNCTMTESSSIVSDYRSKPTSMDDEDVLSYCYTME
ncbi:hypothetical protein TNIN_305571 [Trichonephila inaurata madagascariensis]|uniref:Uncharacterized protein n=1 Tax=Trichonephila inaurata madagascariensis TaxID=2747483 RepID=A0A8X7CLG3_9ARAC|nr:hypothetical protein TNIN_305571 [Trichonephila inaurata madagascariensis]